MAPQTPHSRNTILVSVLIMILEFLGSYLLGIFMCVQFTAVEFRLAGVQLLPFYVFLSGVGFFLWFICAYQGFSPAIEISWVLPIVLIPAVGEACALFWRKVSFRFWRPLWIGFPIGFVGTSGIYWAGSSSI